MFYDTVINYCSEYIKVLSIAIAGGSYHSNS